MIAAVTFGVVIALGVAFAWPVLTYYGGKEGRCAEIYIGAMDTDDCHGRDLRKDGQLSSTAEHCAVLRQSLQPVDARCKKASHAG